MGPETAKIASFLGKYDEFTGALNRFRDAEVEGSNPFSPTHLTRCRIATYVPCWRSAVRHFPSELSGNYRITLARMENPHHGPTSEIVPFLS